MSRWVATETLVTALLLCAAPPAGAIDRFVRPATDPNCMGAGPLPCYTSISAALMPGQAGNGDVIRVGYNSGLPYQENVVFGGRTDLTIVGDP